MPEYEDTLWSVVPFGGMVRMQIDEDGGYRELSTDEADKLQVELYELLWGEDGMLIDE